MRPELKPKKTRWHMAIVDVEGMREGDIISRKSFRLLTDEELTDKQARVFGVDLERHRDTDYVWLFLLHKQPDGSTLQSNNLVYPHREVLVHRQDFSPTWAKK